MDATLLKGRTALYIMRQMAVSSQKANFSLELSELNTLAGIVQKLASSDNSAKNLSSKIQVEKSDTGLTEENLREIETMLKLL